MGMLIQVQVELPKLVGVGLVITWNKVSLHRIMLDARKAKNAKSKRREEIDNFQTKILKTLENPIETAAPAEPQDYVDLAFTVIACKMKDTLNKNEIMDVVEEIEAIVNRACREKRRRMDLTGQQAPLPPPVTASMSTDTLFGGGPGPQGPMAILAYNEPNYYNF